MYLSFVGLDGAAPLPDESTILRFLHLLEKLQLAAQVPSTFHVGLAHESLLLKFDTVVDCTTPTHQTKKGCQWHFGIKGHFGGGGDPGLVHSVVGTAARVRYRGLARNTAWLTMLFRLSNLWMVRERLLSMQQG